MSFSGFNARADYNYREFVLPSQETCEYCSTHFWWWQIVSTAADSYGRGDHV